MASKIIPVVFLFNVISLGNGQSANKILRIGSIFPEVNQKLAFAGKDFITFRLFLLKNAIYIEKSNSQILAKK